MLLRQRVGGVELAARLGWRFAWETRYVEINFLREGLIRLEELDRLLPTTKPSLNTQPPKLRAVSKDFYADFAQRLTRKIEKTLNINNLSNRKDSTFRQWQALI